MPVVCRSCGLEVRETAKFCPSCGSAVSASGPIFAQGTQQIAPPVAPEMMLPPKFRVALAAGTRPEAIILDLFNQRTDLRRLLENLTASGETDRARAVAEAEAYLRGRCVVCGVAVEPAQTSRMPICPLCYDP